MDDFPYSARSDKPEMTEAQKILKEMMPSARPGSSAGGATTTAGASGSPIGAKAAAKLPDFSGLPPHLRPVTDAANSSA